MEDVLACFWACEEGGYGLGFEFDSSWLAPFLRCDVDCTGVWVEVGPFEVEDFAGAGVGVFDEEHVGGELRA